MARTVFEQDRPTRLTQVVGEPDVPGGESNDLVNTLEYDSRGNVLRSEQPGGQTQRISYGPHGEPLTVTDALGNTTHNTFDERGNLTFSVSPTGVESAFAYDDKGNLRTATQNGVSTTIHYTPEGFVQSMVPPTGSTTTLLYDANGNRQESQTLWVNPDNPNDTKLLKTTTQFDAADRAAQTSDQRGNGSQTIFNDLGQSTRTVDARGNANETIYDVRGLVVESRQSDGRVVRTVYDGAGRGVLTTDSFLVGTTEPIFGTVSAYDDAGRVTRSERRKGVVVDLVGSGSQVRSVATSAGTVVSATASEYDSLGRILVGRDDFDLETRYVYNAAGQTVETRTQAVDEHGQTVWLVSRSVYDDLGRVVMATDSYVVATASYPEGASIPVLATRTVYDDLGRAFRSVRLTGVVVSLANGATALTTEGTELWRTETVYDSQGRVARSVAADGQITDFEYDDLSRRVAVIGPPVSLNGETVRHRTETVYDSLGQVKVERVNVKVRADGSLDASQARDTTFQYDEFGQVRETTFADGTFVTAGYDSLGQKVSETNQVGQTRTFGYDGQGRLTAVTLPSVIDPRTGQLASPRYEYGYDEFGNQTLIRDPLGRETRFAFDGRGQQLSRTLPLGFGPDGIKGTVDDATLPEGDFSERFAYDDRGRQTLHVSFEGIVMQSVYDSQTGRLAEQRFFPNLAAYNGGTGTPAEVWTHEYDAFGRQTEVKQVAGAEVRTSTMGYDAEGRLTRLSSPEGEIHYEYDELGRKIRTYSGPVGNPVNDTHYGYDGLSRLATVEVRERNNQPLAVPEVTAYQYDLLGNLDLQRQANGVVVDYVYDNMNRLDKLTHFAPDGTPNDLSDNAKVAAFDYTVRDDGRRTAATETFWIDGQMRTSNLTWSYDGLGRLVQEIIDHYDDALDQTQRYVFDLASNRLEKTTDQGNNGGIDEKATYLYDANDRLRIESLDQGANGTVERTTTYGYSHTQQASKEVVEGGQLTNRQTFGYDLQGRMAIVTIDSFDATGTWTRRERTNYDYDATGMRVSALHEVDANGDGTFETRTKTEYLNDPDNATGYSQTLQETVLDVASGHVQKVTVYTIGLDVISQMTTEYNAGQPGVPVTLTLGYDGHGSTRVLFDLVGVLATVAGVRQVFHFDAYGNLLNLAAIHAATNILYSGEMFDLRIGQQYLRARWYEATAGRFNRMDPFFGNLHDPLSLHKYNYAHLDPVNGTDPTGLEYTTLGAFVNASIRTSVTGMVIGGVYGFVRGGADAFADPDATWTEVFQRAIWGGLYGAEFGGLFGLFLPAIIAGGPYFSIGVFSLAGGYGLYNNSLAIYESVRAGKWGQASVRGGFAIIDALLTAAAVRGLSSAASNSLNPPRNQFFVGKEGVVVPKYVISLFTRIFWLFGVRTFIAPRANLRSTDSAGNTIQKGGSFNSYNGWLTLAKDVTWYEFLHESMHVVYWVFGARPKYATQEANPAAAAEYSKAHEQFVYAMLRIFFWQYLSEAQQNHANGYVPK
jgi:RHS repeat-associated protein